MARLVQASSDALQAQAQEPRSSAQRDTAGHAQRLLQVHTAALVQGYPMALLEVCAEPAARAGLHTGRSSLSAPFSSPAAAAPKDFGELTLLGEAEVQAQMELSRAQQQAAHTTDAVLTELDALMSAAQGLDHVQPERNPLRPYSYLRALQQVVLETGVDLPVRESWMQQLCPLLGGELTAIYQQAASALRASGIAPVGYGRGSAGASVSGQFSRHASLYAMDSSVSQYGSSRHAGFLYGDSDGNAWNAQVQEDLLTVELLRQMLAEGAGFASAGAALPPSGALSSLHSPYERSLAYPLAAGLPSHLPGPGLAAAEALEDMAALEQLVARLSQAADARTLAAADLRSRSSALGWSGARSTSAPAASLYAPAPVPAAPTRAAEIVAHMVETMVEEGGLLAPVQRAVQRLEPAVRQLVRHDVRFFNDSQHPARRLLDEITQRSLAFAGVQAPGFGTFMRLVDEAVAYLASLDNITDARPFDTVLGALQAAWQTPAHKHQGSSALPADTRPPAPAPGPEPAPVVAPASVPLSVPGALSQGFSPRPSTPAPQAEAGPATPRTTTVDIDIDVDLGMDLGMDRQVNSAAGADAPAGSEGNSSSREADSDSYSAATAAALPAPVPVPAPAPAPATATATATATASAAPANPLPGNTPVANAGAFDDAQWVLGVWVEMHSAGRTLRTQLTWVSPQQTLFLFTGADGSTQSMTRRVRDKLASSGALRTVPAGAAASKNATSGPALQTGVPRAPGKPTRR